MAGGAGDDRRSVADKLFAIADAFAGGQELSLSEIARQAGLPLSTAHRLVNEWVEWGGLRRGDDGKYRVGLKLWRLGTREPTARRLSTIAFPYLEDLLETTRENVLLGVLDGASVMYLERLSTRGAVQAVREVGTHLPMHATGVGLALMAYAPKALLETIIEAGPKRFTANTMTTREELEPRLAQIRKNGIVSSRNELRDGVFSIAAPIRDERGIVIAAVSIVGRSENRIDDRHVTGVRLAARGISAALGWNG
ncbi:IclR family transcriptional regulator [Humidisolicoccus flavus]|uniref:IclR family transcriptional regulator n=1 Tax=Humidisolicoccus flavus TaxID=3111414 RepID=UPI00324D3FD2